MLDDRPGANPVHAWWTGDEEQVGAFLYGYRSLWLPQSLLAPTSHPVLAKALFDASRHMAIRLHFNKGLAGGEPDAIARSRETATNPKVLDAFCLAIIATGGAPRYPGLKPPDDAAKAARDAKAVDRATAILKAIAPEAGSYVSESNFFNANWRQEFWAPIMPGWRRQSQIRPRRSVHRPSRRRQRGLERRRLHAAGLTV